MPATRIRYMTNIIHGISDQLKVMPETLVSHGVPIDTAKRKEIAIEYWQNFLACLVQYCISSNAANKQTHTHTQKKTLSLLITAAFCPPITSTLPMVRVKALWSINYIREAWRVQRHHAHTGAD